MDQIINTNKPDSCPEDCSPSCAHVQDYRESLERTASSEHGSAPDPRSKAFSLKQFGIEVYDFDRFHSTNSGTYQFVHLLDGQIDSVIAPIIQARTATSVSGRILYSYAYRSGNRAVLITDLGEDFKLEPSSPQNAVYDYFAPRTIEYAGQLLGLNALGLSNYLDQIDRYHSFSDDMIRTRSQRAAVAAAQVDMAAQALLFADETGLSINEVPQDIRDAAHFGAQFWVASALISAHAGNEDQASLKLIDAHRVFRLLGSRFFVDTDWGIVDGLDSAVTLAQQQIIQSESAWHPKRRKVALANAAILFARVKTATAEKITATPEVAQFLETQQNRT
ncbi:MAG: hypothetical protein ACD_62C00382G0001 [uncultured bacterium]|nr:MAG: hypothetical protein ACD_62C00382G0001 [uncultured bacterium]